MVSFLGIKYLELGNTCSWGVEMALNVATITVLGTKLTAAYQSVKQLMAELSCIEADRQTPAMERLSQIKKIREELNKVGDEIDSIKKEIMLLNAYQVN
jgi:hypothetical protein